MVQVKTLNFANLSDYVKDYHYEVNRLNLNEGSWSLTNQPTQNVLNKIASKGTQLVSYINGKIYYGIKTGLNEAFVIAKTRDKLIAEEPSSAELIRPFLAGKDIKRYNSPHSDNYIAFLCHKVSKRKGQMIQNTHWSGLRKTIPGIANHLQFSEDCSDAKKTKRD